MSDTISPVPKSAGRLMLWLGLAISLLAFVAYPILVFAVHWLHTPWFVPVLGTIGTVCVLWALVRRRSIVRIVTFVLLTALAALEWWFVAFAALLPPYEGPVALGRPFPEFSAQFADGRSFTRANLVGGKDTVLVFFRGHW